MSDSTTPVGAVEQAPLTQNSLEEMLEGSFAETTPNRAKAPEPEPVQEVQEVQAADQDDEPSAEDLPDDEAPSQSANGDEFEIVHNGQQVKLSRAETIKLAQQGFDYDRKTQSVAEQRKAVEVALQRVAEVEQLLPLVAQDLAQVKAIETQLQQYSNIDWIKIATEEPLDYPRYRAQYDQLMQAYNSARGNLGQRANALQENRQQITAQQMQQESAILTERIPEWKDPVKRETGVKELRTYLLKQGVSEPEINALNSAMAVDIARKAMLYDRLKSLKADKSKQLREAPPVVKPGAAVPGDKGRTNFKAATQTLRKLGQQGKHSSQESLLVQMLNKSFK